ncbi:hypothetical protein H6F42_13305 [Pseudanabaena sp. FACHB-1998]|uniref:hypothetical protein n=1 Tax=Pseudanabaena sp. FACHB-1998 TaxID=2692858 RepID=UPI0016801361|nr:hypothetical protein [Pseudanabaena sp. FACHB-1998]MBD2177891.1 hypothetical protein [Pseudanabaena sp. FACHB-1998]
MENWEFLLQRKGDKSWLPLESPTVEILEGQYRLAARSDAANELVGIAIGYQPLAEVRHQPLQQKLAKRISQDGLLIVMPYTNFAPGLWQVDCFTAPLEKEEEVEKEAVRWKKTVKFDVIQISADAGGEWQYSDLEETDLESLTEIPNDFHTNALGIEQTEPAPLVYSSPILEIAEQRSTELVQSMFDEFALFDDDDQTEENEDGEVAANSESETNLENLVSTEAEKPDSETNAPLQPRILLRLQQPQYIIEADNSFNLIGEAYTKGEIEVSLKNPQTLEVVVNSSHAVTNLGDRNASTGAIPFSYKIQVPPPSEIQVLIGDVQIHPHQDFQQYGDLFITQQAIAVSYPASRVLPQLIKEAQQSQLSQQDHADRTATSGQSGYPDVVPESPPLRKSPSYPQNSQSFPQAERPTVTPSTKSKPANALSLPPLPSNKPKSAENKPLEPQRLEVSLSLPPLPPLHQKPSNPSITEVDSDSFPQAAINDLSSFDGDPAFADWAGDLDASSEVRNTDRPNLVPNKEEPELTYSFEEELPQNYEELLEQPLQEANKNPSSSLPTFNQTLNPPQTRNNRFLNKLQTLSAEAIAAQKANQRTEELQLDQVPSSEPLMTTDSLTNSFTGISIDLDRLDQPPLTIAEANSLAELDIELDAELDRLLIPEPDLILNEYVWEETVDPNTFPVRTVNNSAAETLSETAQTIRNLQESSPQPLSEQEAVPIPEIIVPNGEIISGTPMAITVRLPAIAPKFFVKFWIKDLQTRMIVDGPRWLLDFVTVPDTAYIETRTNISIPLSSIDVAFEAIAIEAQTQRESHKVRIVRAVAPPNLAQDNYE